MITFEKLYYNACSPFSLRSVYLFGRLTSRFLPSYPIPYPTLFFTSPRQSTMYLH